MKRLVLCLGIVLVFCAGEVMAVTISLDPSSLTIGPGDTAVVDLNISGLGDFVAPTLGAFDLDVAFDDSILDFTNVTFGTFLGDPAFFEAIALVDFSTGGLLELSLLSSIALNAIQPDAFTLATLEYTAVGLGTSSLSLDNVVLSNALGFEITSVTLENASVSVIPEPSTYLLFAVGILGIIGIGYRQRKKVV